MKTDFDSKITFKRGFTLLSWMYPTLKSIINLERLKNGKMDISRFGPMQFIWYKYFVLLQMVGYFDNCIFLQLKLTLNEIREKISCTVCAYLKSKKNETNIDYCSFLNFTGGLLNSSKTAINPISNSLVLSFQLLLICAKYPIIMSEVRLWPLTAKFTLLAKI